MSHEKDYYFGPALTVTCRDLVKLSLTFPERWWLQKSPPHPRQNLIDFPAFLISTNSGDQNGLNIPLNLPNIIQVPSQTQYHDVPFLRVIASFILGHSSDLRDISSPTSDWTQAVIVTSPNRNHRVPREFPRSIYFRKTAAVNSFLCSFDVHVKFFPVSCQHPTRGISLLVCVLSRFNHV